MSNAFSLTDVSYKKNGQVILDNVSFDVPENSFTTLIGPNGAGKSTLLQLMLGFIQPTKGQVKRLSNLRLGYIPQKLALDVSFPLTVAALFQLKPAAVDENAKQKIETLTQTGPLSKKFLSILSGGELQRVLLAYTLLGDPDILLLDEPLQGLDLESEARFLDILNTLNKHYKKTIFMVSHDLHLVFKSSDYVICLHKHVCCAGEPLALKEHPEYLKLFGTTSLDLMTPYRHEHDHTHGETCKHD